MLNGPVRTLGYRCVACELRWPVVDDRPVTGEQGRLSEPSNSENTGLPDAASKDHILGTKDSAIGPRLAMAERFSNQQLTARSEQSR